ncbi:MAG: GntR family transcriptional regulator [Sphaerochaetaceae bacterium]|nr:GntR family transcriptional regulator [Sphaerochaetaceae bacterium]
METKGHNLSDEIYNLLKNQILSGKLQGGEKIPEESLAKQFGVSRTPIREAVRRLGEYGLVDIKPRCYAVVSSISEKEASDIARVRIDLECLAIDLITPESIEENLKELARHAAECQYALDIDDRAESFVQDSLFHLSLVKASNNITLYNVYQRLETKIQQLRINQNLYLQELKDYTHQHGRIMSLLKEGKKQECKILMYEHIMHSAYPEGLHL